MLMATTPALADAEPPPAPKLLQDLNFHALYNVDWNGLDLGYTTVKTQEGGGTYESSVDIKTVALMKLFTKHKSMSTAQGLVVNGHHAPSRYESNYSTKGKKKHILVEYTKDGVNHLIEPPDTDRAAIPAADLKGSVDLVTLMHVMRETVLVFRTTDKQNINFKVFDGKRLNAAILKNGGKTKITVNGKKWPVQKIIATRMPMAGFTEKELGKLKKEKPLNLYFSDDDRMIPVHAEIEAFYGNVNVDLVRECTSDKDCQPQ